MGTSDNFSLRWNDFEANISSSFRELRQTSEFFDVTLCCDNGTDLVQAHKVILAACSPLFRRILAHNKNQVNPLLYLKGINQKELRAVLDFMYNGEVSVSQDSLNNFLSAAEELAVKGLTATDGNAATNLNAAATASHFEEEPTHDDDEEVALRPKRLAAGRRRGAAAKRAALSKKFDPDLLDDPDEIELKRIKSEPETQIPGDDLDDNEDMFAEGNDNDEDYEPFEKFDLDDTATPKAGGRGASNNPETKVVLEEARFSRTKQGNALLIDKAGYCYLINRKSERKIYWKCQRKSAKSCRSNCQTEGFYITRKTAEHTHPPYPPPRNKYTEDY